MADEPEASNEIAEEGGVADYDNNDGNDGNDINDTADVIPATTTPLPTTTVPPEENIDGGANPFEEEYDDDGPLPDVTVKLIINDLPDGTLDDITNAIILDENGNVVTATPWQDSINNYTTAITDGINNELAGNGTDIGGKGFLGPWTWNKTLVVGLIALCIIGIVLAVVCLVIRRKSTKQGPKNPASSSEDPKVVTKGVKQNPKYSPVPTSV